jgi:hypothetical protein
VSQRRSRSGGVRRRPERSANGQTGSAECSSARRSAPAAADPGRDRPSRPTRAAMRRCGRELRGYAASARRGTMAELLAPPSVQSRPGCRPRRGPSRAGGGLRGVLGRGRRSVRTPLHRCCRPHQHDGFSTRPEDPPHRRRPR